MVKAFISLVVSVVLLLSIIKVWISEIGTFKSPFSVSIFKLSKYKLRPVFKSEWKFIVLRDWEPVDKYWISATWPDGVEEYTLTEAF